MWYHPGMTAENLSDYYDFIIETAYEAGRITLGYYQTGVHPDFKTDDTPVTIADLKSEEAIRSRIETRYPKHAIVGEELGEKETKGYSHRWLIDPIDGTKAFIRGVPLYGILIGLEIDGIVQVGAAYFPALDEMIAAATGLGCWWNGRRAHVSQVKNLSRATIVSCTDKNFVDYGKLATWQRLLNACYYQSGWGDAYGYMLVATSRADLMIDVVANIWDCGPFPPILAEAGGYFGDWKGNPGHTSGEALATNGILLEEILNLVRETDDL
jgi:histidinol-phosphatase